MPRFVSHEPALFTAGNVIIYVLVEQRYYSTSVQPATLLLGHGATGAEGC